MAEAAPATTPEVAPAPQTLEEFLENLILTDEQQQEVYNRFCNQIKMGLSKAQHDKADIKCYITYVQELPTGEENGQYLALDLGGTNFRVLLVTLKGCGEADVENKIYVIPKEVMVGTATQLFDHIAASLGDFMKERHVEDLHLALGFTFSFPCTQLGLSKALLVAWTKGFNVEGVVQQDVGQLLREALERRGSLSIDVIAILNDTTGTLMSCAHRNPDCRIGIILGTGCNACFMEKSENAELLEEEYRIKPKIIINCEWGAFGDGGTLEFIRTEYDRTIDNRSLNKGRQFFEKMIAGMYLGELVRLALYDATKAGVMFTKCPNKDLILKHLDRRVGYIETRHVSDFEADCGPAYPKTREFLKELFKIEYAFEEDCVGLKLIAQVVSKRSATLAAIGLAGLINRIEDKKIVVGVDGSVYRFHPKYDEYLREIMNKFVVPEKTYELMLSDDGSGRGAALVAAANSARKEE